MQKEMERSKKLDGKLIVLGITGSVAAVECVKLSRELKRRGAEVLAVMSDSAKKIIHPFAIEFATGRRVITEITGSVEHVKFVGSEGLADLLLIAPATATTISKIACGVADTPVTIFALTAIGSNLPVAIVPSMHESMIKNEILTENVERLVNLGVEFVPPKFEEKKAKFPDIETICLHVERLLYPKDLQGKRVVVTAGPTFEQIDPIRFISNRSSGLMGKELALEFWRRGSEVVLITSKPTNLPLPNFKEVSVWSVRDMLRASLEEVKIGCDVFVAAAAASDFVVEAKGKKIKTSPSIELRLRAAPKIIKEIRKIYDGDIIGFKAETGTSDEELMKLAEEKMVSDRLSMVVANDVLERGMGTVDTRVLILTKKRSEWVEGHKSTVAEKIVRLYIEDCL